ncbi:DsrE family protein [Aporhodopirellula aestuarii]|uniref:DsrE family protein n=1 Tax=Aporhodopirellula aestuarii TaxID=2950107 RepID=A0ABT0U3H0_9BACT|nr:DsrE family protein [Aporhodopirellula aestuarii]MCM2371459.1 DsrE family protein [Aporhodopirellula aestuarii]
MNRSTLPVFGFLLFLACLVSMPLPEARAQGGPGFGGGRGFGGGPGFGGGRGMGAGQAMGRQLQDSGDGHSHDDRHDEDRDVFQYLLANHEKIQRSVKELSDGVETLTESDDPDVADKIKEHVEWMEYRIEETNPIRMRDPLFAEIFQHTDQIKMVHEDTEKGVRVTETSADPYVAQLIKAHAKAVSGFVERGFAEAMKNHAVPGAEAATKVADKHPAKIGNGTVVRLPNAVLQPRDGTKFLVDITRGSDPDKVNPAIEQVAKYFSIYSGGGAKPAQVEIAVVLHGGATLTVLNSDAYAEKFQTTDNPNLDLLHQLHEAGVGLYVCGQSLDAAGYQTSDTAVFIDTAVSALTAVVNLQADGYAYVPLLK